MGIKFWLGTVICLYCLNAHSITQWEIIPTESSLTFTATQNGSPIQGEFKRFTANIKADVEKLDESSIDIVIDISSINTSYSEVKNTLITADWFDLKLFPKAEFKATKFTKINENNYTAQGKLTIRDKTEPVTLTFKADFPDSNKGVVIGSTTIKRSVFGVGQGEWSSTNEIKDDVLVNFKVSANKITDTKK